MLGGGAETGTRADRHRRPQSDPNKYASRAQSEIGSMPLAHACRLYMHARSHTHSTCAGSWWGEWQHGAAPPHVEVNLEENEALQAAMVEDWADWEKNE